MQQKNRPVPALERNVDLTTMNTMGVYAVADTFVNIRKSSDLQYMHAEGFFQEHQPIILGGGSNLLMVDNPHQPVIKISIEGVEFHQNTDENSLVRPVPEKTGIVSFKKLLKINMEVLRIWPLFRAQLELLRSKILVLMVLNLKNVLKN